MKMNSRSLTKVSKSSLHGKYGAMQALLTNAFSTQGQLTKDTMNPNIIKAEYAVRGLLVQTAEKYQKQLDEGVKLPFNKLIACNIGNPQALQQEPITFHRQVAALVNVPGLIEHPEVGNLFPADAIARAKKYKGNFAPGAYSHSKGVPILRQEVADFITERDGHVCDPEDLTLTDGASQGVQTMLKALIRSKDDGILVPIPQYPLYSAGIALNGGSLVGYDLDEENNWSMSTEMLQKAADSAREVNGVNVRALVVINPGNPTGQVLAYDDMVNIVKFCERENMVLMADEVYQENVYAKGETFTSFKKVVRDLSSGVQLVSFHSTSKGFLGECGYRGGYMEAVNFDADTVAEFYKLASVNLCSNLQGQMMVACMTNPPKEGDESYELYAKERDGILDSLKRRAVKLVAAYNEMEGVTCNETQGALYTFPQIRLSNNACKAAEEANLPPDTFYCMQMLAETGIIVVPGSGFGQVAGTYHFRATILPPENDIDAVIERTKKFHSSFMDKYRD